MGIRRTTECSLPVLINMRPYRVFSISREGDVFITRTCSVMRVMK